MIQGKKTGRKDWMSVPEGVPGLMPLVLVFSMRYMGRKDQMSVPEGVPGLMPLVLAFFMRYLR